MFYFALRLSIAFCTIASDSLSNAEVASSRITIGAFLNIARAIATLCLYPPDKIKPNSPSSVSNPSDNS